MLLSRRCEISYDFFVMVLLSKVIMVLSTLLSLCQSSPRRISSKRKHLKHHHGTVTDSVWSSVTDKPIINSRLPDSTASGINWGGYEQLCETITKTVHLNTNDEEYNPPFYIAVKCRNPHDSGSFSNVQKQTVRSLTGEGHRQPVCLANALRELVLQKCAFNLLHCVQTYTTMYFSRRKSGEDCWQPYSLEIPNGCECMWPVEEFGPLSRRDDL